MVLINAVVWLIAIATGSLGIIYLSQVMPAMEEDNWKYAGVVGAAGVAAFSVCLVFVKHL
jgi:hypothetical protein